MGEMADWLTSQDEYRDDRYWDDDREDDALTGEPVIWHDHTGQAWRLSQMESTHLVNILRLVVNRWAESLGVRPVPIKNPQAILDPNHPNAWLAATAQRMAEELLRRLQEGERLPVGYAVVWDKVVNKIQECLRADKQPLNQKLLTGASRMLAA